MVTIGQHWVAKFRDHHSVIPGGGGGGGGLHSIHPCQGLCSHDTPLRFGDPEGDVTTLLPSPLEIPIQLMQPRGAHRSLCPCCAKSRLFSTTGSHGPKVLNSAPDTPCWYITDVVDATGPKVLNCAPDAVLN